ASIAAHPGYTRTNLQTAGASLGRDRPRRAPGTGLSFVPSQDVEQGTEPMLYAAASPDAVNGGYYGPSGFLELVGPTRPPPPHPPRSAHPRDARRPPRGPAVAPGRGDARPPPTRAQPALTR